MNKDYLKQILEVFTVDQEIRLKRNVGKELPNYLLYAIDIAHNYRIKLLINQYDYPTIKSVGKRGMFYFHYIILHQFDINMQNQYLENCELTPQQKTEIIDRIRFNKGEKQLYGTLNIEIDDKKNLNKRRKAMGLEFLNGYLVSNKEKTKKKAIKKFLYYHIK
ncbi:MAG: DUF6624 domain-containing protein [Candidatus Komeilibacteria bacterium]